MTGTSTRGGRGGGRGGRGGGRGGARPSVKRSAADQDSDFEDASVKLPAKKRKALPPDPPPARAPSSRSTRGRDLGLPDKKRVNRTHEEVAAERAEKLEAEEARIRQRAEAVALIAALDAQADEAAEEERANAILDLLDLPTSDIALEEDSAMDVDVAEGTLEGHQAEVELGSHGSNFARTEDDDENRSSGEYDEAKKTAPKKKRGRAKKGETRAEIEAAASTLNVERKKQDVAKSAVRKNGQNTDAAAASKKAGLSKEYITASLQAAQTAVSPPSPKLGGLADEDANATRPDFGLDKNIARRANEVITIDPSSDAEETPSRVLVPTRLTPKAKVAVKVKVETRIPALEFVPKTKTKPKPKPKKVAQMPDPSSGSFTPESSADVRGLPALVGPTWESKFLPRLYRALHCSTPDPMMFASQGETTESQEAAVKQIKAVLDAAHPGNTLAVTWGDKICSRANSRVRERRSLIAQTALEAVDDFFQTSQFRDQPIATRAYARYAGRVDGPGFWKVPTPENCTLHPQAPGYIKGRGYLESSLIIKTVTAFVGHDEYKMPHPKPDGTLDYSTLPAGLFAMAAAGVERALNLYKATGVRPVAVPKFTKAASGTAVAGYMSNITRFTISRWDKLLEAVGVEAGESDSESEDVLVTHDGFRNTMYTPSSP
ncbi:hypothetical protein FB451DRAFT_1567161 [Mycena latifolia]|nr:hypothetical protein FB451DRAFT_1567161 [Mycena latifolia]